VSSGHGVIGRLIPVRQLSPTDETNWRDLASRAAEPNPLCEPDCLIPAARHQSFGEEISLLVVEEGGRFQACLPLRPVHRWYNLTYPIAANKVRRATYVGTPLVDPAAGTEAVTAMFRTLAQNRQVLHNRLLGLDSLREGGPVARYVHEAAAQLRLPMFAAEDFERALFVRRPEATYFAGLSAKRRKATRRSRRLLTEEFGSPPGIVDRSGDLGAIDEFMVMEAAGYKAVNGVALATVPGETEYFRSMCARFAQADRLLVLALQCGGQTLGMQIWLRGGEGLFGVKVAYDERFARSGPGALLHVDSFDFIHHHTDATWADPCSAADNDFLLRLYPNRTRISTLLFALHGPVDRLFVRSLPRLRTLRQQWRARGATLPPVAQSSADVDDTD
jgi:CelD/BcsL family acetyltransferase involved in cellulose biosynthesis